MSASTLARRRASVEEELAKDSTVSFKKANPATRIEFMRHLLRENVMEVSLAYYAITDEAVIDALRLLLAGIPCRHRACTLHYKLTVIITTSTIYTWSGSANLTLAAWLHNYELLVFTEGPSGFEAFQLVQWLWANPILHR
ncbi:hypothetical protein PR002_g32151 [Phytophthora rubi]|uniref:Uncharacterized protein n=1 Tax=Phytophthora rubi TaxID=129364 RepID=A0A6A3GBE4_9STRA|nr:hypothetical protein PR002_g32151 [Phytophthora rubi]